MKTSKNNVFSTRYEVRHADLGIAANVPAAWRRRGFHNCRHKGTKFFFTHHRFL